MGIIVYSPSWFLGIDVMLETLSVFVPLLISLFAFKIYKLTKEKNFLYFGLGFLTITLSYVVKIISDLFTYSNLHRTFPSTIDILLYKLSILEFVNIFGNLAFRFLLSLGFLMLLFIFLEIKDKRVMILLLYFITIVSAFSAWSFMLFQTTLAMLAGTAALHYLFLYLEKRKKNILFSMLAFGLLFLAQVCFMFTFFFERQMFVLGHILQASGFIILLITYFRVLRK